MRIAEDLRRSVLQAAIEGKLTGGRCEGWRYVTIGDVFLLKAGKATSAASIHTEKSEENCYPCFGGNGIRGYKSEFNTEGIHPIIGRQGALCGCLNMAEGKFYATEHAVVVTMLADTNPYFAYYVLKALNLNQYATATAQPGLSVRKILTTPFPLPPIDEQLRIVSRLNAILPLIAELEATENELDALERSFPGDMRDALLQAAIEGRLTDSNTDNWQRVRLGDVVRVISGTSYGKPDVCGNGIRIIRGGNLVDEKIVLKDDDIFLPYQYMNKEKQVQQNDIVIIASTGSLKGIGRAAFADKNFDEPVQIGAFLRIIRPIDSSIVDYLKVIFTGHYYRNHISSVVNGIGIKNIREKHITELIIPLPPIDEQLRIVSRLNELLPLCDSLKNLI